MTKFEIRINDEGSNVQMTKGASAGSEFSFRVAEMRGGVRRGVGAG